MSFFKKLFGGGDAAPAQPKAGKQVEYKGFIIEAAPYSESGQYQLAGFIRKEIGGAMKEHRFVRADRFAALDDAVEIALSKGRQIVDEQGDRIFG
jgi:hypothetical protein